MLALGKKSSVIREIFEYSKRRKAQIGDDAVFDFSIGNPSVGAPAEVGRIMKELIDTRDPAELHGYTSAAGDPAVRAAIADSLNREYGANARPELMYMTCGAAASLTITLNAIVADPEDEVIVFAPYFPEYRVFVEKAGAKLVECECDADFMPDTAKLREKLGPHTKAVIINSPNNPTGAVIDEMRLREISALLLEFEQKNSHEIYLISDEPYRKLVYGGAKVPFVTNFYRDTIVCYSYSKALSLPGERIGYILVGRDATDAGDLFAAICGAGRALGYVCAPALLQYTVARCAEMTSDLSVYETNRELLYDSLCAIGYDCVRPDGAFYLFVKALEEDAGKFCERAKKYELLLVPSDSFGCPGYVRVAYCVKTDMIKRALPAFEALKKEYDNEDKSI